MGKINRKFIGLSQFRGPFCFELAGKHFHFVLDDGREYSLFFPDGETVQWAEKGKPYLWDSYECLKGDDTTYFVTYQPSGMERFRFNWIIDTAQRLVTLDCMEERYDPDFPRLVRNVPTFGAIKVPGRVLPEKRHHLSARMVGEHIFWHYNPGSTIQHLYHSPNCIRASTGDGLTPEETMRKRMADLLASPDPAVRAEAEKTIEGYRIRQTYYPIYEEPCFHIYINDHLNLLCFAEEIMSRQSPSHDVGGGGILLLQDIERLIDVGVCFNVGEYYMVTAYGDSNEDPDPVDEAPSPYDWSNLTSMPTIREEVKE